MGNAFQIRDSDFKVGSIIQEESQFIRESGHVADEESDAAKRQLFTPPSISKK
jgi:hypothetical protein